MSRRAWSARRTPGSPETAPRSRLRGAATCGVRTTRAPRPSTAPAAMAISGSLLSVTRVTTRKPPRNRAMQHCSSRAGFHLSAAVSNKRVTLSRSRRPSRSRPVSRPRTSPAASMRRGRRRPVFSFSAARAASRRTACAVSRRSRCRYRKEYVNTAVATATIKRESITGLRLRAFHRRFPPGAADRRPAVSR